MIDKKFIIASTVVKASNTYLIFTVNGQAAVDDLLLKIKNTDRTWTIGLAGGFHYDSITEAHRTGLDAASEIALQTNKPKDHTSETLHKI